MSYVWRSILKGVEIIKEGMIWRVGSGENINMWNDPWILSEQSRKPSSLQGQNVITHVSELIDPVNNIWDEQLVRQTFSQFDAEVILRIPICEQHDDFIAWHFDSKGLFTVKSAYRVHLDILQRQSNTIRGESSLGLVWREKVWKSIWDVHCPSKVHHFLWRFSHNSHPMRMNIGRRGIELDTRCAVCCRLFEDGGHLFLRCKELKRFWIAAKLEHVRVHLLNYISPLEILEHILNLPEELSAYFGCGGQKETSLIMVRSERARTNYIVDF
jgi:hypothetical protein